MSKKAILLGGGASALSFVAGYFYANYRLKERYSAIAAAEIFDAKNYYKSFYKKDEYKTPADAVDQLIPEPDPTALANLPAEEAAEELMNAARAREALKSYQGKDPEEKDEKPPVKIEFREAPEQKTEKEAEEKPSVPKPRTQGSKAAPAKRKPKAPAQAATRRRNDEDDYVEPIRIQPDKIFVIPENVFMANDTGNLQTTMTWFAGDGALVTDSDKLIEKDAVPELIGGPENLKFGHMTVKQPNVVYIRNSVKGMDIELLRHEGKYSEVVLGLTEG